MYVRIFDDMKKREGDNPTIGILLCTETDKTIARYSVLNENKQLFAAKYIPYLPTEEELIVEIERQYEVPLPFFPFLSSFVTSQTTPSTPHGSSSQSTTRLR